MSSSDPPDIIRLALFVPGGHELEGAGVAGEWIENPRDGSFAGSFSFGTVEPRILGRIDAAPGGLLVQLNDDLREGRGRVVDVVEALRQRGALAVRIEHSKLGWEIDQWLALVRPGEPWALHRCVVSMLVTEDQVMSCGMHAFSLPDASVSLDTINPEDAQALEEQQGPLTRRQVEEATAQGTCMAVEHRHAQELERARGYADIDPELAWEQWCVVRANRGLES